MPPNQRGLLNWVLSAPSLRTVCEQKAKNKPEILEKFNNCVLALANFRTQHLILVSRYIISQVDSNNTIIIITKGVYKRALFLVRRCREPTVVSI